MSSPLRIAQLTPGTGHFFCGSCLRDHTLCKALRRLGHDAMMVPIYLPFVLEEEDEQPDTDVRLGGIELFLRHKFGRRLPRFLSRWLGADGVLRWGSRRGDMTDASALGEMTVATVSGGGAIDEAFAQFADWLRQENPDVISLSNVMLCGLAPRIREVIDRPIVATMQGEEPFLDSLSEPHRSEAWAILKDRAQHIDHFVAVSRWYGERVAQRLGVSEDRWSVVHNGIELDGLSPPSTGPDKPTIGFLARMCSDKGFPTLIDAYLSLRERGRVDARLLVVGVELAVDRPAVRAAKQRLRDAGLEGDVQFLPNATRDEKIEALRSMSVLSVPATYGESFGLYLLEAHACGVPVVQPRHGAFPEILQATQGGVLCEPDDADDLSRSLEDLLLDEPRREQLGRLGQERVSAGFQANHMAGGVEQICKMLVSRACAKTGRSN